MDEQNETVIVKIAKLNKETGRKYNSVTVLSEEADNFVVQLYNPDPLEKEEEKDDNKEEGGDSENGK